MDLTMKVLEESTQWANLAELYIGLMKESIREDMQTSDCPIVFWDYCAERRALVNSFQAIVPYMGQKKGVLFTGVYLPQKSVLEPPIERQYKPFQKHVSSYQVKRSPGCVVWAAPTLLCLTGAIIKNWP
jgi:hypothetical protein